METNKNTEQVLDLNKILESINQLSAKVSLGTNRFSQQRRSNEIDQLSMALAKAQAEMSVAGLNNKNPFFKSNYANITDMVKATRPSLTKYGLSIKQEQFVSENGEEMLETILAHSSGQWSSSITKINPPKNDIQSYGSYMSYKMRYAYKGITGVVTGDEDDDDGEKATSDYRESKPVLVCITKEQLELMNEELEGQTQIAKRVLSEFKIEELSDIPRDKFSACLNWIRKLKNANGVK